MFRSKGKALLVVVFGLFFLLTAPFVHAAGDDVDELVQSLLKSKELAQINETLSETQSSARCFSNPALAANYLFGWAESVNAQAFPRGASTQTSGEIIYRAYSTGLILATYRDHFFLHQGQWVGLGPVNDWAKSLAFNRLQGEWTTNGRQAWGSRTHWTGTFTLASNGQFHWYFDQGVYTGNRYGQWGVTNDCKFVAYYDHSSTGRVWFLSSSGIAYTTTGMNGNYDTDWGGTWGARKSR